MGDLWLRAPLGLFSWSGGFLVTAGLTSKSVPLRLSAWFAQGLVRRLVEGSCRVHTAKSRRGLLRCNLEHASGQRCRICLQGLLLSAWYGIARLAVVVLFCEFGDAAIATQSPKPQTPNPKP